MRCFWMMLAAFSVSAATAEANDDADVLKRAETTGAALLTAVRAGNIAGSHNVKNLEALQRAVAAQTCAGTNIAWILLPSGSNTTDLYGIAAAAAADQLVVGRHFKARIVDGTADLDSLAASTRSCITLKIDPHAVGLFATEVIAPTPTEFHVFESLFHGVAQLARVANDREQPRLFPSCPPAAPHTQTSPAIQWKSQ